MTDRCKEDYNPWIDGCQNRRVILHLKKCWTPGFFLSQTQKKAEIVALFWLEEDEDQKSFFLQVFANFCPTYG